MTGVTVVTTTLASEAEARDMARALVTDKMAACVQIVPVSSVYRWRDGVEEAPEWLLLCKIRTADYAAVEAAIRVLHPYDTPEIVAMAVADGFPPYLAWIEASTART